MNMDEHESKESMKIKRKRNFEEDEISMLLELGKKNMDLLSGKFSAVVTKKRKTESKLPTSLKVK